MGRRIGTNELPAQKEDAQDYRYMPDPDIPPVVLTSQEISDIQATVPALPSTYRAAWASMNLDRSVVEALITTQSYAMLVSEIQAEAGDESARRVAHWFASSVNSGNEEEAIIASNLGVPVAQSACSSARSGIPRRTLTSSPRQLERRLPRSRRQGNSSTNQSPHRSGSPSATPRSYSATPSEPDPLHGLRRGDAEQRERVRQRDSRRIHECQALRGCLRVIGIHDARIAIERVERGRELCGIRRDALGLLGRGRVLDDLRQAGDDSCQGALGSTTEGSGE